MSDPSTSSSVASRPRPSLGGDGAGGGRATLKREILVNFAILVGAALSLAVVTALVAPILPPRTAAVALVFLIAGDVAVVFLFGRYLIERLVHRPLLALMSAADALAAGDLERRAPPAETREFNELAERFNRMTDRLLEIQGQVVRSEKLATTGRLAAGIAHEVGNPLAALGNYLELLRRRGADAEMLDGAGREIERIDRIVRGLLDFARPRQDSPAPVDMVAVARGAVALLQHQGVLRSVDITTAFAPHVPLVLGRVHALEQVLVNLVLNAIDAAPVGRIVVGVEPWTYEPRPPGTARRSDTSLAAPGEAEARRSGEPRRPWRRELGPGTRGVLVYVADSGPGVPPADRARVFEPFFTTKAPGHGTGLGLAVVLSVVEDTGGVIWVDEAREGGAAFKVFLPADRTGG
ncbi:MAG: HAMP domain-containing protein [Gemmatimonadetes bacterium]|nr:HAMP domain-containing protein [Gemmatimonadota bacterium]